MKRMCTICAGVFLFLVLCTGMQLAFATVYIPDDTSIGTWDGSTFTLTTDVNEPIEITQDNLTLDGAGHMIIGPGSGSGVYLSGRTGVTIKNLDIRRFEHGIYLLESSGNTLTDNTALKNDYGIYLDENSSGNMLSDNTASNKYFGIIIRHSSNNNTLIGNVANSNGLYGIVIRHSDS